MASRDEEGSIAGGSGVGSAAGDDTCLAPLPLLCVPVAMDELKLESYSRRHAWPLPKSVTCLADS